MSYLMPNETSSPNSRVSTPSMPDQTSPFNSRASASSIHDPSSSPSPNTRASSSSMPNHTLSTMLRSSSHRRRESSSISMATSSYMSQPSPRTGMGGERPRKVVGISVPRSNAAKQDFFQDKFLSGDIVQRVAASDDDYFTSPFPAGKRGLFEELHNFHESGVSTLTVQVKRCERQITRRALIVPLKKKHKYVLQDFDDPTHIFTFDDYTMESCSTMQEQGLKRAQEQLSKMRVAAMDVAYPWEKKMQSVNDLSMVYSMLVVPHAYADISMSQSSIFENTVRQAITWLHVSKASGVPLIFHNIQTEPLITEVLEQSSNVDLSSIVNAGTYSLEQSQGIADRVVVIRAIRIWFAFHAAEVEVELEARQGETLLGVTIARTREGFCYVTEVVPHTAAFRVGLKERLDATKALGMKLVVTKVGNDRVLPWLISNGCIRCYDTNSISRKLLAHRSAGKPACLHLLDIREAVCPTVSHAPEPMSTFSIGVEGNASTYMEF